MSHTEKVPQRSWLAGHGLLISVLGAHRTAVGGKNGKPRQIPSPELTF